MILKRNRQSRSLPLYPACLGILAITLALSSCDDDPTSCPVYDVGAVEGYLISSGEVISAEVGARAMEGPSEGTIVCATQSDSSGWYRLDLPTGLYRMEVKPSGGYVFSSDRRDTIRITPHVHRYDLLRGRAEITVGMPAALEGARYSLRVSGEGFDSDSESADIEDGELFFAFPILHPGPYLMSLSGISGRFYLPDTPEPDEADTLHVDEAHTATYEIDFSQSHATISGNVTGSWQQVSNNTPYVRVIDEDSHRLLNRMCQSDGSFTCDLIVPQPVRLRVDNDGIENWIGGDSFETAQVFDLAPGTHVTGVSFVGSGIRALLTAPDDPFIDRHLTVLYDGTGTELAEFTHWENPATICNLLPGSYFLHVAGHCEGESWIDQWFDGTGTFESATPIVLGEGELRDIEITLVGGGGIEGAVLTPDGQPPEIAVCGLFDALGDPICPDGNPWRFFEGGIFSFSGLPDGEYYLAVAIGYGTPWWYPGTLDIASSSPFTIEDHGTVSDIELYLPDPKAVQP